MSFFRRWKVVVKTTKPALFKLAKALLYTNSRLTYSDPWGGESRGAPLKLIIKIPCNEDLCFKDLCEPLEMVRL